MILRFVGYCVSIATDTNLLQQSKHAANSVSKLEIPEKPSTVWLDREYLETTHP